MQKVKIVSFDVDGTLIDAEFNDLVWLEEIPRLYAEKEKISFEEAHRFIVKEYEKVGDKDLRWYDMDYWLRTLELGRSCSEILRKYEDRIKVYPDAEKVLETLKKRCPMIVITLMPREFLEVKLRKLNGYFTASFSTVSDFKSLKTSCVYKEVCRKLNVQEDELLHVGDLWEMDYVEPKKAGVNALCIDRTGKRAGNGVIGSLEEVIPIIPEY